LRQLQLTTDFAAFDDKAALDWLYARNQFSMKLGLDTMRALLSALNQPEASLRILHVAGTNGKGSVCGNIAALLQVHGYRRVGLYTSPHLVSFRERIRVDGKPLPREVLRDFLRHHGPLCERLGATYFEIATALALDHFRAQNCEAVVLETGLGGRLDATNTVMPLATAITPVDFDHMAQLGPTLPLIFAEKAAILKPGAPMVLALQHPDLAEDVAALRQAAQTQNSTLIEAANHPWRIEVQTWVLPGRLREWRLPASLRPESHQRDNLALAFLAFEAFLEKTGDVGRLQSESAAIAVLTDALADALPAGRTQVLLRQGRLPLVLDGAHNPHGLRALDRMLREQFAGKKLRVIFAMMADKPVDDALALVQGFAHEMRFAPLWRTYARAWQPPGLTHAGEEGQDATGPETPTIQELTPEALRTAMSENSGADAVVVCGSLYLLGQVIAALCADYPELSDFIELAEPNPLANA
jgi:dihydrofolate synthase / folylpolyglutamate synthase